MRSQKPQHLPTQLGNEREREGLQVAIRHIHGMKSECVGIHTQIASPQQNNHSSNLKMKKSYLYIVKKILSRVASRVTFQIRVYIGFFCLQHNIKS